MRQSRIQARWILCSLLWLLSSTQHAHAWDMGFINHFLACPNGLGSAPDHTSMPYFKMGCRSYVFYGRIRPDHLEQSAIQYFEQEQDWQGLAEYVLDNGYPLDISDYYLGEAAEGMGLYMTAEIYYSHAQYAGLANREWSCQRIGFDVCHGLRFPEDAWKARQRLYEKLHATK